MNSLLNYLNFISIDRFLVMTIIINEYIPKMIKSVKYRVCMHATHIECRNYEIKRLFSNFVAEFI